MIRNYRILLVLCLVAVVVATPATLIMAAIGEFLWAEILLIVSIATFIGFVESRRRIKQHREFQNRYSHKHIKPI